jgi:hypothetical protein
MNQPLYKELSVKVLGMAFKVHNTLGTGPLEATLRNAWSIVIKRLSALSLDAMAFRHAWMH